MKTSSSILATAILFLLSCGNFTYESQPSSTADSRDGVPGQAKPIQLPMTAFIQEGDDPAVRTEATPIYSGLITEENHHELTYAFCGNELSAEYGERGPEGRTSKTAEDDSGCYGPWWSECHRDAHKEENTPCREHRTVRVQAIFVKCDYESEEDRQAACPAGDNCGCLSNSLCVDPCEINMTVYWLAQALERDLCLTLERAGNISYENSQRFADLELDAFSELREAEPPDQDGIPVYFVRKITKNGVGGVAGAAFSPWSRATGVVIARGSNGYNNFPHSGSLLAHELGHQFGLLHTFGSADDQPPRESCEDGVCCAQGDLICDTPPDVEWCQQYCDVLSYKRGIEKRWSQSEAAEKAGIPLGVVKRFDACDQAGIPQRNDPKALLRKYEDALEIPVGERSDDVCEDRCRNEACDPDDHNHMSYRHAICRSRFSETQLRVMTCWLRKNQDIFY